MTSTLTSRENSPRGATVAMLCALVTLLLAWTYTAAADVPVRVSVKFIVDAAGNRPATGSFNTTAEVNAEADAGTDILKDMLSEHRIQITEIIDLPTSLSGWSTTAVNGANRDSVRTAAMASPGTWSWRTNAVNVYVTGGAGTAVSKFPPNNDIILFGQNCGNSPSCLLHELGHSLNLLHTHEGGGADGCADTLLDDDTWNNTDQMAQANYGVNYSALTAAQQNLVDQTWSNFMSYHTTPPQLRYSSCQKDRVSTQGYTDRAWLLAKEPVYVGSCVISCNGSFLLPYQTLQQALSAGGLAGKVIVLDDVDTTVTSSTINLDVEIDTREGKSHIDMGVLDYVIPTDLEKSSGDVGVREAIREAQDSSREARKVARDTESAAKQTSQDEEREKIRDDGRKLEMAHRDQAIEALHRAEGQAHGEEQVAIQLELAQRYWHRGEFALSRDFYTRAADTTNQPRLQVRALYSAQQAQDKLDTSTGDKTETTKSAGESDEESEQRPGAEPMP